MSYRILCVDDEPKVLKALQRKLFGQFKMDIAEGPIEGLKAVDSGVEYAVVLSDQRMPGMDGSQFLAEVSKRCPDTVRIMLTGNADMGTAVRAVNEGNIFRFLTKPCDPDDLTGALRAGIQQHRLLRAEKEVLEGTLNGCVKVLTEILSMADPAAFGRASEMKEVAGDMARHLEMEHAWEAEAAVMLASLGRVTMPPELLAKVDEGQKLTADETAMLASIPDAGGKLIANIPRMESVAKLVQHQGEPDGIPEEEGELRLAAGVLHILTDLAAEEIRCGSRAQARKTLEEGGRGHDPRILEALVTCLPEAVDSVEDEKRAPTAIAFKELLPGCVLTALLETRDGRCIIREGNKITAVLLARLRNHQQMAGIKEPIYVESGSLLRRKAS